MTKSGGRSEEMNDNNSTEKRVEDDAVFKTDLKGRECASEKKPETERPSLKRTTVSRKGRGIWNVSEKSTRKSDFELWLPSNALLTEAEIFASIIVVTSVSAILAYALTTFGTEFALPDFVELHPVLSTILSGLVVGLYVLTRLRAVRLARLKHLRGEK